MKQTIQLIFAFFIITTCLKAQKVITGEVFDVRFGFPYEIPKGYNDLGYFGNVEEGFIQVSHKSNKDLCIQLFNKDLKMVKENHIELTSFPKDFTNEGVHHIGNKYYWFFSTYTKDMQKESMWVQEIETKEGKLLGKAREVIQSSVLEEYSIEPSSNVSYYHNKFGVYINKNDQNVLITYRLKHLLKNNRENHEEIGFLVLDENINIITNKIATLPMPESIMNVWSFAIDSKGNAYMVTQVHEERKIGARENLSNYHFVVFRLRPGQKDLEKIIVDVASLFIQNMKITELSNNRIIIGGYYSKNANSSSSDGVFLNYINENGIASAIGNGFFEFPLEAMVQFMSPRKKEKLEKRNTKNDIEVNNLSLSNIVSLPDGGIQVVGEVYVYVYHRDSKGNVTVSHQYGDIMVLSIDSAGKVNWMRKIPKDQNGQIEGDMSFTYFLDGQDAYFFFSDYIQNSTLNYDKKPLHYLQGMFKGILFYVKIDSKGNLLKNKLFEYKTEGIDFCPREFSELDSKTLVNKATNKRISKVVLVTKK